MFSLPTQQDRGMLIIDWFDYKKYQLIEKFLCYLIVVSLIDT